MTGDGLRLSVVIVNYHSVSFVRRCIESIEPSWCERLVIVDNSTDPHEADQIRRLHIPVPFHLIVEERNVGFGTAANHGIDQAFADSSGTPVWLLNPDTEPAPDAAAALLRRVATSEDDILSPAIITGPESDRRVWFTGGTADSQTGDVIHDDYLTPYQPLNSEARIATSTSFMCGAAAVFTPRAWMLLGGFREDLFLYWEDVELSLRAQDLELRMTIVRDAVVWHAVGGTADEAGQSKNFYYYSARNRLIVMLERGRGRAMLRPQILVNLAKLPLRAVRRESSAPFTKASMALWGYLAGITLALRGARHHGKI